MLRCTSNAPTRRANRYQVTLPRPLLACTMLAMGFGLSANAAAQSVADQKTINDVQESVPSASASSGTRLTLGAGAVYVPRYAGSDEYRYRALPLVDYRDGRFFAGVGGVGYNVSPASAFQFGPVLSYRAPLVFVTRGKRLSTGQ